MKLSSRWWLIAASLLGAGLSVAAGTTVAAVPTAALYPASPAELYGTLFEQIQLRRLFADGKVFVDAVPKRPANDIVRDYLAGAAAGKFAKDEALLTFVLANFKLPEESRASSLPQALATTPVGASLLAKNSASALQAHITSLWPVLTREPDTIGEAGSLLDLPGPYVVPGGRFREVYYWDSYFTLLGLQADGQTKLVDSMVDNFVSLVERFGHVPNGNRSYYLSRSQPPVLYLMVELAGAQNRDTQRRRLQALRTEHAFWMSGERVVTMPDGTPLNRYWDTRNTPREESFREDTWLAKTAQRPAPALWRDLRASAESGWDFSSRWFADGKTLASIDTTNVVPVDLNALLYGLERSIAGQCRVARNHACTARFETLAERRRSAVERFLWDPVTGHYTDWDIALARPRAGLTAAALFPLFTGLASPEHAHAMARITERQLLAPGGLRTTLSKTGQQWDAPNGWAPLQWVAFDGLRRYGEEAPARQLAERFLATVQREFNTTGKLVEKYNVETPGSGSGGEYPLQDGFGWTNGVVRALTAAIGAAAMTEDKH